MSFRAWATAGIVASGLMLTGCTGDDSGKSSTATGASNAPRPTAGGATSKAPKPGLLPLTRNDKNVLGLTNGQTRTCAPGYDAVDLPDTSGSAEFKGAEIKTTLSPEQVYNFSINPEDSVKPVAVVVNGYAGAEVRQDTNWWTMDLKSFAGQSNKKVFSVKICFVKKP